MNYAYHLAALKLESDLDLPDLVRWEGPRDAPADIVVRFGKVPLRLDAPDHVAPVFQTEGSNRYLLTLPGTGRIQVQNGCEVTVDPDPTGEATGVRAFISSTIQAVLWHQRGLVPLHAGAVAVDRRVLALAGPGASGKSTLVAMLAAKGHRVMADDVCVIDVSGIEVKVHPISSHLRLWRDAVDHLGIPEERLRRTLSFKEQFVVDPGGYVHESQMLAAVVVLTRRSGGALSLERLQGSLALGALRDVVHTRRPARALGRNAAIFAALTRVAAGAAVARLRVPDDPACLDDAAALALTMLEA
jgi:hypothetical protein